MKRIYNFPRREDDRTGYEWKYLKAMKNNEEKACFIGNRPEYRIRTKDSILVTLTDTGCLLDFCIYPLYVKGDKEIGNRIRSIMLEILEGGQPIEIYQVADFIGTQDFYQSIFEELPLVINVDDIAMLTLKRIDELSEMLKNYNEGELAGYADSIYEMLQRIINTKKSFQEALRQLSKEQNIDGQGN